MTDNNQSTSRLRIGLLSPSASRLGGGVFEAVVAHAGIIRSAGHEPVVFALEDEYSNEDRGRFGSGQVVTVPSRGPRAIGYAPGLLQAMLTADLHILHLHGIWMYPSLAGAEWAARTGRSYVISPHGMLDPWIVNRAVMKKAIAKLGYERKSWRRASLFHALTSAEATDIQRETGRSAIEVVPNAVGRSGDTGVSESKPNVVYLGRIHPKKNVEELVAGWSLAADSLRPLGAKLLIAGWGTDEHVASLQLKIAEAMNPAISFLGPVFGEKKTQLLEQAHFLALPSQSEGLPMAILESWAAGTPTLMSRNCNLPQGFTRGAAIDCGTNPQSIAQALREALTLPRKKRETMAENARTLAEEEFSPHAITGRWNSIYCGLAA